MNPGLGGRGERAPRPSTPAAAGAMPDLMLHADKGLKGISRTGGTLLGADCSTEKMPAAIRLSFAGDADGLAMLADRHGANILSAQEPTTDGTRSSQLGGNITALVAAALKTKDDNNENETWRRCRGLETLTRSAK